MKTWLSVRAYAKLMNLEPEEVFAMIENRELKSKEEGGETYVQAESKQSPATVNPAGEAAQLLRVDVENGEQLPSVQFVEKTIGTILNMHEKVVDAKDETLEALKSENQFLKEALVSMQELYEEDRQTISALTEQLNMNQEELEFVKRKYKLMWGKVVEGYGKEKR